MNNNTIMVGHVLFHGGSMSIVVIVWYQISSSFSILAEKNIEENGTSFPVSTFEGTFFNFYFGRNIGLLPR